METKQTNNKKNGKIPAWKKPIEKDKYTEDELELIKTSRAVMRVIEKQIARGDFDYILQKEETDNDPSSV